MLRAPPSWWRSCGIEMATTGRPGWLAWLNAFRGRRTPLDPTRPARYVAHHLVKGMAVSEVQRIQKRHLITDAAISVFAEKGFRSARVSDVARVAGVADGTIYLYFRNKEDLLLSIFEEKMGELIGDLRDILEGVDCPLERIRVFAGQHFKQLQAHPELAQVFQVELRQSHKFLREYRPEKLWAYLDVFADSVKEGQRRGLIRSDMDSFVTKWAFFGALDELSIQWVLTRNRERFDLDHVAAQVVEMFLVGLTAPAAKE
jgi:TetR/AcrR family fatty acid metabolism transcriptional regulator